MTDGRTPLVFMYSQCPQCKVVFNVSEADIHAHRGLVRCGRCRAIFHVESNHVEVIEAQPVGSLLSGGHGAPAPHDEFMPPPAPRGVNARYPHQEHGPGVGTGLEEGTDWIEPVLRKPGNREDAAMSEAAGSGGKGAGKTATDSPLILQDPPEKDTVDRPDVDGQATASPAATRDAHAPDNERKTATPHPVKRVGKKSKRPRLPTAKSQLPDSGTKAGDIDGAADGRRAPVQSPYAVKDVKMAELTRPRPFTTASISLLTVFLVLLLFWQVKAFYLDDLAQVPILRPYLQRICQPLGCVLPPRRAFARINLMGTGVDTNPELPGALEIKASLINRAHFPQPYPPLRVTLTDNGGRIVGRRTFLPSEYRGEGGRRLLPIKAIREVTINLAQPAAHAVGYEVELVPPSRTRLD